MSGIARYPLPAGWAVAPLEELLVPLADGRDLHHGWSPQCEKESTGTDEEWGVLKTTAIQAGEFLPEHNKKLPTSLVPRPQHEVKVGDLLITCAGPRVRCGVPCLVRSTRPRLMLSGKMYRFRVSEKHFDARYLEKYLLSHDAQVAIDAMKTGGNESGLNLTHSRFKPLPVPVAPLNEQRRISFKIEELFSRIDEGERALERVSKLVERYRQSVLKAAVTGELTRNWREERKAAGQPIESGEVLLTRILAARREAWEQAELSKMQAKSITPEDDAWKKKYKEAVPTDCSELVELPDGWTWASIDEVAADTLIGLDRGSADQRVEKSGCPYIKMNNVTMRGEVLFDDVVYITASAEEKSKFALKSGDILFNTRNSKELVGKTGLVVSPPFASTYNNNLMRIRSVQVVDSRYLVAQMCEPRFRERMELVKKATTSVAAVYAKDLLPLGVAVPPIDEQAVICSEVDRQMSLADQIEKEITLRTSGSRVLRQSLLRAAFRGELVEQNPSDEPASALLARIAAERAESTTTAKKRARKKQSV